MANFLKNMLGIITVEQTNDLITVGGMATQYLTTDILRKWGTSKINTGMFKRISSRELVFDAFFALEVHYMLKELLTERYRRTSKGALQSAITQLEQNTWLVNLPKEIDDSQKILNRNKLSIFYKTPLEHQVKFFDQYEKARVHYGLRGLLLAAGAGTGKAQPLYSNIKTPTGWTTMGQIQMGDTVTAWDGSPSKVIGVYPQGQKDVYELTFKDGRTVHACGEHLWRVYNNRTDKSKPGYCNNIQTTDIIERLEKGLRSHIDLFQPEEGTDINLPIDPYLLGVVIGDGGTSTGSVMVHQEDQEVYGNIAAVLPDGVELIFRNQENRVQSCCIARVDRTQPNSVAQAIINLGLFRKLSHEKFIPETFFNGSKGQRLALLQGLMDTDGTACSNGGSISYCTTSDQLALDVQRLVWSLGGIARISAKQTYYTYFGERRAGRIAFNVNIRMKDPTSVFRLTRKKALVKSDNQYSENLKLEIVKIEKIGTEECQCIAIDHPDHLYVTDGYVVTHNTLINLMISEMLEVDHVIIVSPNNAVRRVWEKTLNEEYKKPQHPWIVADNVEYKGQKHLITHFEGLQKLVAVASKLSGSVMIILDESHGFNESESLRTELFLKLGQITKASDIIWASGTPIKALGKEAMPLLSSLDPLFTPEVAGRYKQIFGLNAQRALDILRNRMGFVKYSVESSAVVDNQPSESRIHVQLPDGDHYTLASVRQRMLDFITDRLKHYESNYKSYEQDYQDGLAVYENNIGSDSQKAKEFKLYLDCVKQIKRAPDPRFSGDQMKYANKFEKERIMPALDNEARKRFHSAKSVIKYVRLKVMGEALGSVLGRARAELHVKMLDHIDFDAIMAQAQKKTVIFTSYVDVVKQCGALMEKQGRKPMLVHGETNKDLASNVGAFEKDPKVNPLIATFPSLSTAVPLVMADQEIFLNVPFRSHELVQAKARIDRLGQDTPVKFVFVQLDTGKEPNISTRSADILEWSRQQVASIMGADYDGDAAAMMGKYEASLESIDDIDPAIVEFESALADLMD